MYEIQIGRAATAPVSLVPSVFGWSKPIQATPTIAALNPQNHASTFSLVVPVFPARSARLSVKARVAVPTRTTSFSNDVMIHADSAPFWLTERRPATRHHELHPGVTDTPAVQARMIADLSRERWPVVVREHRFPDAVLETAKSKMRTHVPVGAPFLDEWVARRYAPGSRYGMYELMRPLRSW